MWSNKVDNVLCTYRPYYSSDYERRDVEFTSQKIKKQKLCGVPGVVQMKFNRETMRYYEMNGQMKVLNPLDERPVIKHYYETEFEFRDEDAPF